MIQKRSYILSTKINIYFYDIVKIRVIIIQNVNIFTIYQTLFQNVISILPIIYQNKTKMYEQNKNCRVIYRTLQNTLTIYKLFGYNFWWNCLEFTDKMGLISPMKMFNNVKHHDIIFFKFGDIFFTSLTMLGLESKGSISSTNKGNLLLYCRTFSAFMVAVNLKYLNNRVYLTKKHCL